MSETPTVSSPTPLAAAREALTQEWLAVAPDSPEAVASFYQGSQHLTDDLTAWHETMERQRWTQAVCHVASQMPTGPIFAIDIGCGGGHDLAALRAQHEDATLWGVEPNTKLRIQAASAQNIYVCEDIASAPLEEANLLICLDVLEHIPDPEAFLGNIAKRTKLGAVLIESTATWDIETPLHLAANRGWHPGRILETHGWQPIEVKGRIRLWQRVQEVVKPCTVLLVCAYRALTVPTFHAVTALTGGDPQAWRVMIKAGDALISRSRSALATAWWRECAADVALFIDDDIEFPPEDAERIVQLCRDGHDIICGAYSVRNGQHLAIRGMGSPITFGPNLEPIEIRYGATGFMAIHRKVFDALIPTLPLCHGNQEWSFWPVFDTSVIEDPAAGGHSYLSEDWHFCEIARRAGFKVWLDPSARLSHMGQVPFTVHNMHDLAAAIGGRKNDVKEQAGTDTSG